MLGVSLLKQQHLLVTMAKKINEDRRSSLDCRRPGNSLELDTLLECVDKKFTADLASKNCDSKDEPAKLSLSDPVSVQICDQSSLIVTKDSSLRQRKKALKVIFCLFPT